MGKLDLDGHRPFGFGNTSRRFSTYNMKREKGKKARDRFAFEQEMQGNYCTRLRKGGDFVVQRCDFFGNKIGISAIYEVKSGNSKLTETQEKRKRQLGRERYKIVRY